MTNEELQAARRERARHWLQASAGLHSYPALADEDETVETLAAELPERGSEKKGNAQEHSP